MPEGDTILRARNRLDAALTGEQVTVSAPNRRGVAAGVPRLDGRVLERVDAHGKHLILHFGDLVLHSHLGMKGAWHVYTPGARWRRPHGSAWAVLLAGRHEAVQFNGSTLRVLPAGQLALDPQLSRLGPDILAPDFQLARVLAALRRSDRTRTLGDALLDQRLVAGIGNIYKSESCFAAAVSPWQRLSKVDDQQLTAVLEAARELMLASVVTGRENFSIYRHRGPCGRCGGRVRHYGQGDSNRTTWWCESCQR